MALTKIQKTGVGADAVDASKIGDDAVNSEHFVDGSIDTAHLGNLQVTVDKLAADAVNATKIADDAVSEEHLDVTAITGHTELAASAAANDVLLIFDTSSGTIKKIQSSNVGLQTPTITGISPANLLTGDGTGNHTIVVTGTSFLSDVTTKLTTSGGTDIAFDSVTRNSSTQLTCVVAKNKANLTNANEPFDLSVTTATVFTATSTDAITIDASPVFVTAAGSLGSVAESTSGSFTVLAQDPESSATAVTYELQSGTLPTGFTITNQAANGGQCVLSGTSPAVSGDTTFNFTIRAVDAASNTTSRAFSIAVINDLTSQSFTSSGTFAVPSGVTSLNSVLVVAGGGGGPGQHASGGGAGGLVFMPAYPVTPGGTLTVTVGNGGATGPGPSGAADGQDSVFGAPGDPGKHASGDVLTAKGGGKGGHYSSGGSGPAGGNGGSGGGAGVHEPPSSVNPSKGTATQPTQPGDSGAYGFGNPGGTSLGGYPSPFSGGGGGGAGAAGGNGVNANSGAGGIGKAYTIADGTSPVYYAGGGGGGKHCGPSHTTAEAQGGGGRGSSGGGQSTSGQANKGGGGGSDPGSTAGSGGKGIVIVRY